MADLQTVYARVENGVVVEYPVFGLHIVNRGQPFDWYTEVQFRSKPELPAFHVYKETLSVEGGQVIATYAAVPLSLEQILGQLFQSTQPDPIMPEPVAAAVDFASIPADTVARVTELIKQAVQKRLDTFAQAKGYDSMLSACTYATSSVAEFQAEGQKAIALRDSTWQALYAYLGQVQSGGQPVPRSFADVEASLPALAW